MNLYKKAVTMDDLIYIDLARSTSPYHSLLTNALLRKLLFVQLRQIATVQQQVTLDSQTYSVLSRSSYSYYAVTGISPRTPKTQKKIYLSIDPLSVFNSLTIVRVNPLQYASL